MSSVEGPSDFRFWHKADMTVVLNYVLYRG
jgi:hypothetical protein